jgi:hypothetical protein
MSKDYTLVIQILLNYRSILQIKSKTWCKKHENLNSYASGNRASSQQRG